MRSLIIESWEGLLVEDIGFAGFCKINLHIDRLRLLLLFVAIHVHNCSNLCRVFLRTVNYNSHTVNERDNKRIKKKQRMFPYCLHTNYS